MQTLLMSLRERDRLTMFRQVEAHQITLVEAADRLSLSYRQARRLWKRYREVGDGGLVHGLRGRSSNNQALADDRRDRAVELYRERYQGFGPTLAAEQLAERDGVLVDHETLRGWLVGAGLWKVKRQPRRSHRRRPRKACFGELVQLDGSDHHWFGPDVPRCVLMVMIDDATGRVLDKTPGGGCVSWRGRRLELMGKDAGSRRRREVVVRERLDGRVELTTLDGSRVLSSREVVEPPKAPSSEASQAPEASAKPPLVERVAGQSGPKKPAKNHPWRSPLVGVGSVAARCAHLHYADPHEPPTQGTLLLG